MQFTVSRTSVGISHIHEFKEISNTDKENLHTKAEYHIFCER